MLHALEKVGLVSQLHFFSSLKIIHLPILERPDCIWQLTLNEQIAERNLSPTKENPVIPQIM